MSFINIEPNNKIIPIHSDGASKLSTHTQETVNKDTKLIHYNNKAHKTQNLSIIICLLAIFIISYVKFTYRRYIHSLFNSIFSYRETAKLFVENNMRVLRGSIILSCLSCLSSGLFLLQIHNHLNLRILNNPDIINYIIISLYLIIIYLSKSIIIRLCGYMFNIKQSAKEYIYTIYMYNKVYGIIITPIICLLPYSKEFMVHIFIILGLSSYAILFFLRLFRGIWILFKKQLSIFYMILYLCALEILPLLLIIKTIITEVKT